MAYVKGVDSWLLLPYANLMDGSITVKSISWLCPKQPGLTYLCSLHTVQVAGIIFETIWWDLKLQPLWHYRSVWKSHSSLQLPARWVGTWLLNTSTHTSHSVGELSIHVQNESNSSLRCNIILLLKVMSSDAIQPIYCNSKSVWMNVWWDVTYPMWQPCLFEDPHHNLG